MGSCEHNTNPLHFIKGRELLTLWATISGCILDGVSLEHSTAQTWHIVFHKCHSIRVYDTGISYEIDLTDEQVWLSNKYRSAYFYSVHELYQMYLILYTENLGIITCMYWAGCYSSNTVDLYLACGWFKSWPRHQLSFLKG